jgi:hypothetical protein
VPKCYLLLTECNISIGHKSALELVFTIDSTHLTTIYIVIIFGTVVDVKGKRLATNGTNWSWWIVTKSLPQPFLLG